MNRLLLVPTLFTLALSTGSAQSLPDPASWRRWVVSDLASYPVPPPPPADATQDEADDLKIIAGLRNENARESVRFWDAGAPPYRWMQIAQQEIASHNIGGPAATRAMALVAVAMNDAILTAWSAKYVYQRPRPSNFSLDLRFIPRASKTSWSRQRVRCSSRLTRRPSDRHRR